MIGSTIGHYKMGEKLGEGGMGVVYKAQDTKLNRTVALKFLPDRVSKDQAAKARFLQEAQAAAGLNHPNICTIHGVEEVGESLFMVLELVEGGTLRDRIPFSTLDDAINIAIQVGEALQEAHSKGIVHRDIKADNVMLTAKGLAKVMDFGLAKLKGTLKLTRTSSTVGTLAYMAPEQIQGGEADHRSDIFSFGVLLFEMLTGKLPFRGEHEAAMVYSIVNEEPQDISKIIRDLSPILANLIQRCLEKDPAERYQTMLDVAADIRRAQKKTSRITSRFAVPEDGVSSAVPPSTPAELPLARKRKSLLIFTATGIGFVLMVLAVFWNPLAQSSKTEINQSPNSRRLHVPFKSVGGPKISPDGKWIVFTAEDLSGKSDLYVMDAVGTNVRRRTHDLSDRGGGADISPDGSLIAYFRIAKGIWELCVIPFLDGPPVSFPQNGVFPKWRPDGLRVGFLVHNRVSSSGKNEFHSVEPDGRNHRVEFVDSLGAQGFTNFSWSPDGRSIAWIRAFPYGKAEIVIRDLVSGLEKSITNRDNYVDDVCWTNQGYLIYSSDQGGSTNLWGIPEDGGASFQITRGGSRDQEPSISADGSRILYNQYTSEYYLHLSDVSGSTHIQLMFDGRYIGRPSLSPDRQRIAYSKSSPDWTALRISVMTRSGQAVPFRPPSEDDQFRPVWSPDGKYLSYMARRFDQPLESSTVQLVDGESGKYVASLGTAEFAYWIDNESLALVLPGKTNIVDLEGRILRTVSIENAYSRAVMDGTKILFASRGDSEIGVRIVSASQSREQSRYINASWDQFGTSLNGRFLFAAREKGTLVKISLSDLSETVLSTTVPGLNATSYGSISYDGSEIVYVESRFTTSLAIIEGLFK